MEGLIDIQQQQKWHVDQKLTSPGLTHPTAGDTVSGAPAGTTNSNDVGPTSTMGPDPILGTGWVNSFALVCELMTSMWAAHVSETAVAFILMTECESSSGGRTPTARQCSLNSRPIPVLQVRSNSYSCNKKTISKDFFCYIKNNRKIKILRKIWVYYRNKQENNKLTS